MFLCKHKHSIKLEKSSIDNLNENTIFQPHQHSDIQYFQYVVDTKADSLIDI